MNDILYSSANSLFSFRVAALILHNDKVMLVDHFDRFKHEYAFPGGHVQWGETGEAALIREMKEETNLDIAVKELVWVHENFWMWGDKPCHQIAFYYRCELKDHDIRESYYGEEQQGSNAVPLLFRFVPIQELATLNLYPEFAANELAQSTLTLKHFISPMKP